VSISSKSINRINKAVETQNTPAKVALIPPPKTSEQDASSTEASETSGITQKLPDYLL
jgi:hypothetical protein